MLSLYKLKIVQDIFNYTNIKHHRQRAEQKSIILLYIFMGLYPLKLKSSSFC